VRVKHGLVSAGTVSLETPVVRGSVVPRYPKFQDPQHLEFWWASVRSSRTTVAVPRRMASGCACAPGPAGRSWRRGGGRAARASAS